MITVLGVLILVCAVFLVISVLLQSSKNHRMSGVVSGGAETFFGKQKGKTIDAKLSKATAIISVIFCILILVLYYITANANKPEEVAVDDHVHTEDLAPIVTDEIEVVEDEAEVEAPAEEAGEAAEEAPAEEATDAPAEEAADTAAEEAPAEGAAETAEEAPAEVAAE